MPHLQIRNLTKNYGATPAVSKLSIELSGGEIFGFIGPNGAGKTTTIKCIAGLLNYDEGEISINGKNSRSFSRDIKSRIGYIPDTPFLYDKLTGEEFLHFVGRIYSMTGQEIENGIGRLSERLEFRDYMKQKTEDYSHGMKQRIVIASAFIHDPDLILIDEPMVGLDPKSMRIVKDMFKESASENRILFISTHTLALAEEICTSIGVMNLGHLVYSGGIGKLKETVKKENLEELYLELTKENADSSSN